MKVCIIGCTHALEGHLKGFGNNPNTEIYSVVDPDEGLARESARKANIERWHTDYREALKDKNVDIVAIAVPYSIHTEITIVALSAGKHVLTERPMALSLKNAERICHAAKENNVKLAVEHNMKNKPKIQEMKRLIQNGEIGQSYFSSCSRADYAEDTQFNNLPYWSWLKERKFHGGVLTAIGTLGIDLILYLIDDKVSEAYSVNTGKMLVASSIFKSDVDDTAIIIIKFQNGSIGRVTVSWKVRGGLKEPIRVDGTKGSLVADEDGLWLLRSGREKEEITVEKQILSLHEIFIRSIIEDKEPTPFSGHEAIETVRVLDMCYNLVIS